MCCAVVCCGWAGRWAQLADAAVLRCSSERVAALRRHLHTRKPPILHRDLKSPNLLVDGHYRVKVRPEGPPVAGSHSENW